MCACTVFVVVCLHVCPWICAESGDDLISALKQYEVDGAKLCLKGLPQQALAWDWWYHWYSVIRGDEWQQKKKNKERRARQRGFEGHGN